MFHLSFRRLFVTTEARLRGLRSSVQPRAGVLNESNIFPSDSRLYASKSEFLLDAHLSAQPQISLPQTPFQKLYEYYISLKRDAVPVPNPPYKVNEDEVFCNSEVHMPAINVIGFDYDFTIANYTKKLEYTVYDLAREQLIQKLKYPSVLQDCVYDDSFPIRGLWFDTRTGFMLKLNYMNIMSFDYVFHGRKRLKKEEILKAYGGSKYISIDYRVKYMRTMADIFSLPEICLIADVIDFFRREEITFDPTSVHDDVTSTIRAIHKSGLLHEAIMTDLPGYLIKENSTKQTFQTFLDQGKKLFLLSNSGFEFINAGMSYIMDDKDWLRYFDVTVASAKKPEWFSCSRPFRRYDTSRNRNSWETVSEFLPGEVYSYGNLEDFMRMKGYTPNSILYVGDHVYSDLQLPYRKGGWRTGALIRELDAEIKVQSNPHHHRLSVKREICEELLRLLHASPDDYNADLEKLILLERKALNVMLSKNFNSNWGSIFRAGPNPTTFAFQLFRYVDIYASNISSFAKYPAHQKFIVRRRQQLSHETRINIPRVDFPTTDEMTEESAQSSGKG